MIMVCYGRSMTADELDCVKKIDESRSRRIAKGSGVMYEEVDMLLKMHKQYEKMFGTMGKSGLMKGSEATMMQQMTRNPNAVMQQLQRGMSGMDPRMLSSLGGAGRKEGCTRLSCYTVQSLECRVVILPCVIGSTASYGCCSFASNVPS
jgi:hypothetical protein